MLAKLCLLCKRVNLLFQTIAADIKYDILNPQWDNMFWKSISDNVVLPHTLKLKLGQI